MAQFSKATRFLAPVLVNTLLTWLSTVRLLIISRSPISWLVSPWATRSMISSSRSERSIHADRPRPHSRESAAVRTGLG